MGAFLCGVGMIFSCLSGRFSAGTPVSTHSSKICELGLLATLNCPCVCMCLCWPICLVLKVGAQFPCDWQWYSGIWKNTPSAWYVLMIVTTFYSCYCSYRSMTPMWAPKGHSSHAVKSSALPSPEQSYETRKSSCWMRPRQPWTLRVRRWKNSKT